MFGSGWLVKLWLIHLQVELELGLSMAIDVFNTRCYIFNVSYSRKVAGAIRVIAGRKSIEPNLPNSLQTRNHLLDDMFSARTILVEEKKKKKKDDADSECSSEDDLGGDDASCRYVEKVGVSDVGY